LLASVDTGLPKLWLVRQALHLRRRRPDPFTTLATYRSLATTGRAADHVVAFARGEQVVTIVPRLPLKLARGRIGARLVAPPSRWADTRVELPHGRWRDVLTGESRRPKGSARGFPVARVLDRFPVALLEREDA
jgi:(1->4)-alpha-D-glucan 1-alpha-D-glucosylmutase